MKEKLRQYLALHPKLYITDANRVPAAVVLPIFSKNEEYWILFIKRTETVKHHKGQISFPGGQWEKADGTLQDTALRELHEEIGVPPDNVELLGELDDSITTTSDYTISPFVGLLPYPYRFKPDPREIAYIIEIPISALLKEDSFREEEDHTDGSILYFYHYQDNIIWGATARILKQFLDIWVRLSK